MLTWSPSVRVFLARGATDLRKSFDGLAAVTQQVLGEDPQAGHLYAFCNRRRDRIRILFFDGTGYWVFAKRLEQGTFAWPDATAQERRRELSSHELSLLLGGIDLRHTKPRKWYRRDGSKSWRRTG